MKNAPVDTLAYYLNALRNRAGLSVREFAKAAGYANGSSVQRYLDDPSISVLPPKTASKLAQALFGKGDPQITLADLAPLVNATLKGSSAMTEGALAQMLNLRLPESIANLDEVEEALAGRLPVVGSAYASKWMAESPSLDAVEEWLTIPFMDSKPISGQYVLRLKGTSLNKISPEDSYAICHKFNGNPLSLPAGKVVHAQRELDGEIEWTLKVVKWGPSGMMLCPDSTDPAHQDPIKIDAPGYRVSILGVVMAWYRPA